MDVLITGAARGIGALTAQGLAARGHRVALVGLEPEELERVSGRCPGSIWIEADVTDEAAMAAAFERAVEAFGGLDAVHANAGISTPGFVRHLAPGVGERVIEVNLQGVLRTARLAVPHLIDRRGYLLLTASVAAFAHMPAVGPYAASKAGVEALAHAMRLELSHHGVDVGVAYYSWIDTEMVRGVDRIDVWGDLRAQLRPPFHKTYPAERAAADTVRGIERRARNVMTPGWLGIVKALRAAIPRLAAPQFRTLAPESEAKVQAAIDARGADAVVRAVGAGGAADREAAGVEART